MKNFETALYTLLPRGPLLGVPLTWSSARTHFPLSSPLPLWTFPDAACRPPKPPK